MVNMHTMGISLITLLLSFTARMQATSGSRDDEFLQLYCSNSEFYYFSWWHYQPWGIVIRDLRVGHNLPWIQLLFEPWHIDLPPKRQNLQAKKLITASLEDSVTAVYLYI